MPEQQDGSDGARKPDGETLPQTPVQASGNSTIPPPPTNNPTAQNPQSPGDTAKKIEAGERYLIYLGVAALFVNSFIAIIYWRQLQEMVGVAGQTDSLTRASRRQEMDIARLAEETHDLAESSRKQSIATKIIADNAVTQAAASKSAANTAKNALHVSERAYIQIPTPIIDYSKKAISVSFINKGHIPTGTVNIIIHEATLLIPDPATNPFIAEGFTEFHWSDKKWDAIAEDGPVIITTPIVEFSGEKFSAGNQKVVVAGFINYNDGFPNTTLIKTPFCWITSYHLILKAVSVDPCEPSEMIPRLEKLDGYPNTSHKQT